MARKKKLRIKPQPPIDRWAHPSGQRPRWVALVLIGVGLVLAGWSAGRRHDVFNDGSLTMSETSLMREVTVGGPRHPAPPPSELDMAIQQFLGDQANDLTDTDSNLNQGQETPYDFCPT